MTTQVQVRHAVIIARPAGELYQFWRDLTNLPTFMSNIERIEVLDKTHSRWYAQGPANVSVSWDSEIVDDVPNERIAWMSVDQSDVDHSGEVTFQPSTGGRGTLVMTSAGYYPPGGKIGEVVAKLFGDDPEKILKENLVRFKRLMEAGELPTTEGQPHGQCK